MWPYREVEKYLRRWEIWVSFIFLFIPGILYQLQNKSVNLSNFQGILIVIFLALAIYYSIPFLFLGFGWNMYLKYPNGKFNGGDFFIISFFSMISYSGIYWVFTEVNRGFSFWICYLIFAFFVFILGINSWVKLFKGVKND